MAIRLFAERIKNYERITMFGDGSSIRDYTYVDDIVGVVAAVDSPLGYQIINLGNFNPIRLDTLISEIEKAVGKPPLIDVLPDQPGDVPMTFADVSRAKDLLKYAPNTPISHGLKAVVDCFLSKIKS